MSADPVGIVSRYARILRGCAGRGRVSADDGCLRAVFHFDEGLPRVNPTHVPVDKIRAEQFVGVEGRKNKEVSF